MQCVVLETCWPNADTVWKAGQVVEVTPVMFNLLEKFLKPVTRSRVVTKDVRDGTEK
jgi:hypothetical protein